MTVLNLAAAVMVILIRTREEAHESEQDAATHCGERSQPAPGGQSRLAGPSAVLAVAAVLFIFLQPYRRRDGR